MRRDKEQKIAEMEPRHVAQRIEELEAALPALILARGALRRLDRSDASLVREIDSLSDELNYLRQLAKLPVQPRDRPKL